MMKAKMNTNNQNGTDSNATAEAKLKELNRLERLYQQSWDNLQAAYRREIAAACSQVEGKVRIWKAFGNKIEILRRTMPKTKVDNVTGEYFLAEDADGNELFRVQVKSTIRKVLTIKAKNADEAIAKAREEAQEALSFSDAADEVIFVENVSSED